MSENIENEEKKIKREIDGNQENITYINDYIRFITQSEGTRKLEKLNKYKDGTDNWVFSGWYGSRDDTAMFRNAMALIRDNKLKERETNDLKYYIRCFEEAKEEITNYFRVEF